METYPVDKLRKYIGNSELRIVNKDFHVRLSKELAKKYDDGIYNKSINNFTKYIKEIKKLKIQYPANANPVFYLYLVPDENFIELLNYPYKNRKGGGKPVPSYDLDGFDSAYGESQNLCSRTEKPNISQIVNSIHELAHLVHSQFFRKNSFICEGFAEALTLYTMDYENKFDEHRNAVKNIKKNQIFSVKELLDMEEKNSFYGGDALLANKSCSFDLTYISSYLFVRGYIKMIEEKFKIGKIKATQKFLEIARSSKCTNEWFIFDLANALDISKDDLLNGKEMQFRVINEL